MTGRASSRGYPSVGGAPSRPDARLTRSGRTVPSRPENRNGQQMNPSDARPLIAVTTSEVRRSDTVKPTP